MTGKRPAPRTPRRAPGSRPEDMRTHSELDARPAEPEADRKETDHDDS